MQRRHRAWAEIDLDAFRHNLMVARRHAGGAEVWPVLKANAYGHGARALAAICAEQGVARIGVGDSSEALELRESGLAIPLLVLGTVIDAELPALLQHDIEVGVHSEGRAHALGEAARRAGRRLGVHLKIDTGLTRLGVLPEAALRVALAIDAEEGLELRGVMSHFVAALGFLDPETKRQQTCLDRVVAELRGAGLQIPVVHSANSSALFTAKPDRTQAVRPGTALYGLLPDDIPGSGALRPVLSLHAQIVFLKDIQAGTGVGYGSLWRASHPTRIATLPIGFADGVPWRLGRTGKAQVLVRGQRCPMVGNISMDYCCVDVGHVRDATVGDTATLIGRDGEHQIRVVDMARDCGTVGYEITCSIGSRVRRVCRPGVALPRLHQTAPTRT